VSVPSIEKPSGKRILTLPEPAVRVEVGWKETLIPGRELKVTEEAVKTVGASLLSK